MRQQTASVSEPQWKDDVNHPLERSELQAKVYENESMSLHALLLVSAQQRSYQPSGEQLTVLVKMRHHHL